VNGARPLGGRHDNPIARPAITGEDETLIAGVGLRRHEIGRPMQVEKVTNRCSAGWKGQSHGRERRHFDELASRWGHFNPRL
jgi:hypothetical protein